MNYSQRPLGRPKKENNGQPTKEKILHTATELFLKKGYTLISMNDVAQNCNITKATVYYYYKTKSELFTDAMVHLMLRIKQSTFEILLTKKSLKEQLFTLAKIQLKATIDIDINSFMKEAKHSLSDKQQKMIQDVETEMYRVLENRFKKAMDDGEIPKGNPYLAAFIFISILTSIKGNEKAVDSVNDLASQVVNFFWNGLANND